MLHSSYIYKLIIAILIAIPAIFMVIFKDVQTNAYVPVIFILLLAAPTVKDFFQSQKIFHAFTIYIFFTILAISIELIGVKTGFPYGRFEYSDLIPMKVAGEVPITLALTFVPILIGAFAISQIITDNRFLRIILTTIFLVLADLVLDPGAVYTGMWIYENQNFYYNVPLSNYLGWILTGFIFSTFCVVFMNNAKFKFSRMIFTYEATVLYWTIVCCIAKFYIPIFIGTILLLYIEFYVKEKE
jgi:putative membrane protein